MRCARRSREGCGTIEPGDDRRPVDQYLPAVEELAERGHGHRFIGFQVIFHPPMAELISVITDRMTLPSECVSLNRPV